MKKTNFINSNIQEIKSLLDEYLQTLTGVVDDFWEEHILTADVYIICEDEQSIGCFAIHNNEKITMFYIRPAYISIAQDVFKKILSDFKVQTAFVVTCDSLFLNLCMDFHKRIEMQAYFFNYGCMTVRSPEYSSELLKVAIPSDEADILDKERVTENIALGKYYVMRENGIFLGQGFFNELKLIPKTASIGMSVHPDFRRKGVGRSIIMHLVNICHNKGITPNCGCWYYNHNSKATLESAGFVAQTRLLNVFFKGEDGGVAND